MVIDGHSEGLLQALFLQNPRHHTGRLPLAAILGQASRIITKYLACTFRMFIDGSPRLQRFPECGAVTHPRLGNMHMASGQ